MKFSVAATILTATNPSIVADSSANDGFSPLMAKQRLAMGRTKRSGSNPNARTYREYWTMPRDAVKDIPQRHSSDPGILTNLKRTSVTEDLGIYTTEHKDNLSPPNEKGADLGILSSSRRKLNPLGDEESSRPGSDVFNTFTAFDRDRTAFYSICDPTVEDEYLCSRCDTNQTEQSVADFECQKISCYEVDSRCPNNKMVVCRYDTLTRMFDYEPPNATAQVPYRSEKCRKIEARLSKRNRAMAPDEESSWDFDYCLRYNIDALPPGGNATASGNNTCQMEVGGIVCNSCSLEPVETNDGQDFCVTFDCGNTLLGYSGSFCDAAELATKSIDYFVYRSLPCDGGCNLCGPRNASLPTKMNMMAFPEESFVVPELSNQTDYLNWAGIPQTMNCFGAQWLALSAGALSCPELTPSVQATCGCMPVGVDPPLPEPMTETNATASDNGEEDSGVAKASSLSALVASLAAAAWIGFGLV